MTASQQIDLNEAISLARADLARRLSVADNQIKLHTAEAVTWRDGSLGCPQPDKVYMQMLVEGYLIELEADETRYSYHGSRTQAPYLCE